MGLHSWRRLVAELVLVGTTFLALTLLASGCSSSPTLANDGGASEGAASDGGLRDTGAEHAGPPEDSGDANNGGITILLSATPPVIEKGHSSTLQWSATQATSCTAEGAWTGPQHTSGSKVVSQFTNSTYTLTCTGPGGTATKSVTVVSPPVAVTADAAGVKRFTLGGEPFVPIGANYLLPGPPSYPSDDMFDTQSFDLPTIDSNLKAIAANGFVYVRLWLKGRDTENGFTSPVDAGLTEAGSPAFNLYVSNVVATIHSAEKYGLHVVLTWWKDHDGAQVPKNYLPDAGPLASQVTGENQLYLIPAFAEALGRFFRDLLSGMLALDPNIGSDIFYLDLYNEARFDVTQRPLDVTADAGFTDTFGGVSLTYQLNNFAADTSSTGYPLSRQALLDTATQNFVQTVGGHVTSVMPRGLVTASSGSGGNLIQPAYRIGFDGAKPASADSSPDAGPDEYPLRPYFVLKGGANLIDVHEYPADDKDAGDDFKNLLSIEVVPTSADLSGTLVSATVAPLIAGEFGQPTTIIPNGDTYAQGVQLALALLQVTETDLFCNLDYTGFGVWDWSVPNDPFFCLVPPDPDAGEAFMEGLAPRYVPKFCGVSVTPVLSP